MAEKIKFFRKLGLLFASPNVIKQMGHSTITFNNGNKNNQQNRVYPSSLYLTGGNKLVKSNPFSGQQHDFLRKLLYYDYEMMDKDSIPASVLDIYTDDSTQENDENELLKISSDNEKIVETLETLFYDILNIDFSLHAWIRNLLKYGDFFLYLNIEEKSGIVNAIPLSPYNVERIEGEDDNDPTKVYFKLTGDQYQDVQLENYEMAHFRLLNDIAYLPYGKSILESGRHVWKQLKMMEDAMLIYRVTRAPERRVFYIDVGGLRPDDVDGFMQKIINRIKRVPVVDERTGELNLKYNVEAINDDFFFATRNGNETARVDTLAGGTAYEIDDVEYLRNKLFAAFKVPKSYLTYEEDLSGKSSLAQEDVRFSRTINRLQKIVEAELTKIAMIHLYSLGFKGKELIDFDIRLTHPSTIHEKQKLELLDQKISVMSSAIDNKLIGRDNILKVVMDWSDEEILKNKKQLKTDAVFKYLLQKLEDEGDVVENEESEESSESDFNFEESAFDKDEISPDLDVDDNIDNAEGNEPEFNID